MKEIKLNLPLNEAAIRTLKPNDKILLSGTLYTARDQAHKRLLELIRKGEPLPIDLKTITIFYCGPSPAAKGKICGAVGPTTSSRMDPYTQEMLASGLKVMIGKGERSDETAALIRKYGAVYFTAVGGISAVLSRCIVSCETWLWEDLGAEAVYRLEVFDLPVFVNIV